MYVKTPFVSNCIYSGDKEIKLNALKSIRAGYMKELMLTCSQV